MSGAVKHMERSHRSHRTSKPFVDFERKAPVKKSRKENKSLFEKFKELFKQGGESMNGIIITAIICLTLVALALINKKKEDK